MTTKLTMRELQKIFAAKLRALPHSVPIKSGDETVAVLVPMKRPSPERVAEIFDRIDAAAAAWTPEQRAEIERLVGESFDA